MAQDQGDSQFTTLMLRNIPCHWTAHDLIPKIGELQLPGGLAAVTFLYAPWNRSSARNMGFAFIDFSDSFSANEAMAQIKKRWSYNSLNGKPRWLTARPAHVQGLAMNLRCFCDNVAKHEQAGFEHPPLVFEGGVQLPLEVVFEKCGLPALPTNRHRDHAQQDPVPLQQRGRQPTAPQHLHMDHLRSAPKMPQEQQLQQQKRTPLNSAFPAHVDPPPHYMLQQHQVQQQQQPSPNSSFRACANTPAHVTLQQQRQAPQQQQQEQQQPPPNSAFPARANPPPYSMLQQNLVQQQQQTPMNSAFQACANTPPHYVLQQNQTPDHQQQQPPPNSAFRANANPSICYMLQHNQPQKKQQYEQQQQQQQQLFGQQRLQSCSRQELVSEQQNQQMLVRLQQHQLQEQEHQQQRQKQGEYALTPLQHPQTGSERLQQQQQPQQREQQHLGQQCSQIGVMQQMLAEQQQRKQQHQQQQQQQWQQQQQQQLPCQGTWTHPQHPHAQVQHETLKPQQHQQKEQQTLQQVWPRSQPIHHQHHGANNLQICPRQQWCPEQDQQKQQHRQQQHQQVQPLLRQHCDQLEQADHQQQQQQLQERQPYVSDEFQLQETNHSRVAQARFVHATVSDGFDIFENDSECEVTKGEDNHLAGKKVGGDECVYSRLPFFTEVKASHSSRMDGVAFHVGAAMDNPSDLAEASKVAVSEAPRCSQHVGFVRLSV